ncbi:MAG: nucleoside triphosphate hydrolase [Microbacteriaceae bacterium]|nr:nucleoside triphosphate hydrolase [Microbacteriaceae bacterium]
MLPSSADHIASLVSSLIETADSTGERIMVGIVGTPGTGKSTVAEYVVEQLPAGSSVIVPMDGFHLANAVLEGTPLRDRKGAIDTFDPFGYVSLLERIRRGDEDVVYAPSYRRGLEEPIAASIAVARSARFVITEGNYLLSSEEPWCRIRSLLDQTWYVEVDEVVRVQRLIARHERFGMSHDEAVAWARSTDEANARYVESTRSRADVTVEWF